MSHPQLHLFYVTYRIVMQGSVHKLKMCLQEPLIKILLIDLCNNAVQCTENECTVLFKDTMEGGVTYLHFCLHLNKKSDNLFYLEEYEAIKIHFAFITSAGCPMSQSLSNFLCRFLE